MARCAPGFHPDHQPDTMGKTADAECEQYECHEDVDDDTVFEGAGGMNAALWTACVTMTPNNKCGTANCQKNCDYLCDLCDDPP